MHFCPTCEKSDLREFECIITVYIQEQPFRQLCYAQFLSSSIASVDLSCVAS